MSIRCLGGGMLRAPALLEAVIDSSQSVLVLVCLANRLGGFLN